MDRREHSLELGPHGDIEASLAEIAQVYRKLAAEPIMCDQHAVEMVLGDEEFICPHCEKRYLLGVKKKTIFCRRDDIRENLVDEIEVPNIWIEDMYEWEFEDMKNFTINTKNSKPVTKPNVTWRSDNSSVNFGGVKGSLEKTTPQGSFTYNLPNGELMISDGTVLLGDEKDD